MPSKHGPEVEKEYHTTHWQKFRAYILAKRHYTCEICGEPGYLVHHIIHVTAQNVHNPKIMYNEDNVQVLCEACHNKIHFAQEAERHHDVEFDENGNLIVSDKKKDEK